MRIALVHYSYVPVIGGVETVLAAQAKLFADHGHEVTIVCGRGASLDPRVRVELLSPAGVDALVDRLHPLLARQDFVLVHNVLSMPFDLALTEALWQLGSALAHPRFFGWVHDLAACNADYQVEAGSRLSQAHPKFTYVAVSEVRRRQFETLTGAPCLVIPNGIDPAGFLGLTPAVTELVDRYGLLEGRLVLLHPTRLLRRKNVEFSLRVAASLIADGHDGCLLITGPPDAHNAASATYAEALQHLHRELGLGDRALFLHEQFAVGDDDLRSIYRLSDALLFPSHQEGFGLPLLEAALARIPIFCPDQAPLNALLPGGAHLFAPEMSPAAVGGLIVGALEKNQELCTRRTVLREYAWAAVYEKYLAPVLSSTASC